VPKTKPMQSSFAAGELDPTLITRGDTTQYRDGARSLLNNRILIAGGARRRPGSSWLAVLAGDSRLEEFIVNETTKYIIALSEGRWDAYLPDGTASGSITGCPWTADNLREMDYEQVGNTAFLTAQDLLGGPQVITRTGASSWSRAAFPFYSDYGGRTNQPYHKLAPPLMVLEPSAITGAITLGLSGVGWWHAGMIGKIVRYHQREILVTGVTNANVAAGTVIEELPPTQRLTIPVTGFAIGQVVAQQDTGAKGVVLAVGVGTIDVIQTETLNAFTVGPLVVGPKSMAKTTGVSTITPGASQDWDEALFTPTNGYPACCAIHRNRLIFSGHPRAPNAVTGSKIDNLYNFDVGDASDGDGFLETIGDAGAAHVKQLHSAEQLLLFTDRGPYYVPETSQNPFRPSSLAFNRFGGEWPCSVAPVGAFDGGVVFVSGSLVVKCRATGDSQKMWVADEVSLLSAHIVKTPNDTFFTTNYDGGPERYAGFINSDGTIALMQLVEAQEIRNFVPWNTSGVYRSGASINGDIYVCVQRTIDAVPVYLLEMFDDALTLDAATEYADEAAMAAGVAARYPGTVVNVVVGTNHLGTYPPTTDAMPAGPYTVGLFYDRIIETLPPIVEDSRGSHAGEPMRIIDAAVNVIGSARFAANGHELTAYQTTDDLTLPPPLHTGWRNFTFLGWRVDPTVRITQADPLPLTVPGVRIQVAY
jgi:hypothetical protein